jgi:hypothetical protein
MASVLGRLEERECTARKRVEELQAEPEAARSEWDEWLIARRRVGEVWDDRGGTAGREGLSAEELEPDYQQVMDLLAERRAAGG